MPASKSLITKTPEETRQAVKKLQDEGATKIQVTPIRTPGKSNGRLDAKKENKKNKQKEKNSTDPDPKTQAEGVRQGQDESRNKGGGVENLGNGEETSDDTKGGGNIEDYGNIGGGNEEENKKDKNNSSNKEGKDEDTKKEDNKNDENTEDKNDNKQDDEDNSSDNINSEQNKARNAQNREGSDEGDSDSSPAPAGTPKDSKDKDAKTEQGSSVNSEKAQAQNEQAKEGNKESKTEKVGNEAIKVIGFWKKYQKWILIITIVWNVVYWAAIILFCVFLGLVAYRVAENPGWVFIDLLTGRYGDLFKILISGA